MGTMIPKQFLELKGRPLFIRTLQAFERCPIISDIILVVPPDETEAVRRELFRWKIEKITAVVAGGVERKDSVQNGLRAVPGACGVVAVHDGARPLVTPELITRTVEAAKQWGAAVPCVRISDTVKQVSGSWIEATVARESLRRVQTPQCFSRELLETAYRDARESGTAITDEAMLVERMGKKIRVVEGDPFNIKITTPEDLVLAAAIIESKGRED
ncbi:2-C-methyl-D-erythritol 4-phosphate cytidylyltransferase [bacterium]|nr:2-C-methyl-D-erythritol 4-phosphate cytidylyltransferase [bacterium]